MSASVGIKSTFNEFNVNNIKFANCRKTLSHLLSRWTSNWNGYILVSCFFPMTYDFISVYHDRSVYTFVHVNAQFTFFYLNDILIIKMILFFIWQPNIETDLIHFYFHQSRTRTWMRFSLIKRRTTILWGCFCIVSSFSFLIFISNWIDTWS